MGTVEKRNKHKKRRFVSSEEKLERELKDCMHCRFFWGHNNRCANGTCCKPSKKKRTETSDGMCRMSISSREWLLFSLYAKADRKVGG